MRLGFADVSPDAANVPPSFAVTAHQEIGHRLANSLQLISALLSFEGRGTRDPVARNALESAVQRISAVAGVHRQLYRSSSEHAVDIAAYLRDLAEGLEKSYGRGLGRRRIVIHAAPTTVPAEFATMLGILVSELVMNACKHAYAPTEPGSVDVCLFFPTETEFWMEVRDYGGPIGTERQGRPAGLGTQIIDAISRKLRAHYAYAPDDEGMRFIMNGNTAA